MLSNAQNLNFEHLITFKLHFFSMGIALEIMRKALFLAGCPPGQVGSGFS